MGEGPLPFLILFLKVGNQECDHRMRRETNGWFNPVTICHQCPTNCRLLKRFRFHLTYILYLTGWWFGTFYTVPYIGNFIIPFDFHIFRGVGIPPTS
jgi:hypothetical protein